MSSVLGYADPWSAIAYVSSGFTLIAFIALVISLTIRQNGLRQKHLIETAGETERAKLVDKALEFFDVDTQNLTTTHQFEIAMRQIEAKAERFRITAIVVGVVACLGTALSAYAVQKSAGLGGPPQAPVQPTSKEHQYREFESEIRKHVKLVKPGESEANIKHLAIAVAQFTQEGDMLLAELKPVGGYDTPWEPAELRDELRDNVNRLKDENVSKDIRGLPSIKSAYVVNVPTMDKRVRESLITSREYPQLTKIYEDQKKSRVSERNLADSFRYFIVSLPDVEDAESIVNEAFQKWSRSVGVRVTRTLARTDANLIVDCSASRSAEAGYADSQMGPPRDYEELSITFNNNQQWSSELLSTVACHEFGHILGLEHSDDPATLMYPAINKAIGEPMGADIELARKIWQRAKGK